MNTKVITDTWVKLSFSDLAASRILYEQGHYRTSYFLFQQASEKANKAFALYAGLVNENDLKDIGHNQFKIYRRTIVKHEAELKNLIKATENLPSKAKDHEILGLNTILSVHKGQSEVIKTIDRLKNEDLINISTVELNQVYKQLLALQNPEIKLPKDFDKKLKQAMLKIADLAGTFETTEAMAERKELENMVHDKEKLKELSDVLDKMLRRTTDVIFIFYSLWICALLTIQHSSLARYPLEDKNPLQIYTSKLPIIKKQSLFMELLADVLKRLKKLNK
jgi:hypothetical protein